MLDKPRLLIATSNVSKIDEFRDLLAGCGWEIVAPRDLAINLEVEENGASYAENAHIKALAYQQASGLAALADDSGLEVDALGGEPGATHHVKGWDGADQADRIDILLKALSHVPAGKRTASRGEAAVRNPPHPRPRRGRAAAASARKRGSLRCSR